MKKGIVIPIFLTLALVGGYIPFAHRVMGERLEKERNDRIIHGVAMSGTAIISLNDEGQVIDWSGNSEGIFGFTRDEMMGGFLDGSIIPPGEYSDRHHEAVVKALQDAKGGESRQRTILCYGLRKDGSPVPLVIRLHIPFDAKSVLALINEVAPEEIPLLVKSGMDMEEFMRGSKEALDTGAKVPPQ
jgi:PAS domain S-box-containing protein